MAGWARDARIAELGGATMGTGWRVRLARPPGYDLAGLHRALEARLEGLVAEMSHWAPTSLLSRFNRAPAESWTVLPPDFAAVIAAALAVAARSGGAFDPTIGALVDLWGFGPQWVAQEPTEAAINGALRLSGWRRLQWDAAARRLRQPGGMRLDLSGIAKGYAVDCLAALLVGAGIHHALVEIGGEFVGLGLRPDGDPWWVDLETPGGMVPPLRVALHQIAVATSGDYVRGRHTIDPRTGRPIGHALAVSVLHRSAMCADAWATALGVLPRTEMIALAEAEALAVRALLRGEGGIEEWISPALAAMIA